MIHVGISGPIAAGKSTLATQLQSLAREVGYAAEIESFAAGIRELVALEGNTYRMLAMTQKLFDWGYAHEKAAAAARMIDGYMRVYPSQSGIKNRRLLQVIGTEVGREYLGADAWIHRTQQLLRRHDTLDFAFSDDLRFDNEAMAVDVHVAITIPVERAYLYYYRLDKLGGDYTFSDHASEKGLTLSPLFTIPVEFDSDEVRQLFDKLDYIRRLRQ